METRLIKGAPVASEDFEAMSNLVQDLDDYGLKYSLYANTERGELPKGEKKEYTIRVRGANITKALKSPAFWNFIAKDYESASSSRFNVFDCGLSTFQTGEAISKMLDQLSLMWGFSSIERDSPMTGHLFADRNVYTKYTFRLIENGCGHGNDPIIIIYNQSF